jgi:O-acetyl-ADP-ribose deacetylase (regulator of RNase III)
VSITYKAGCIVEAFRKGEVGAIAHQANCFNTMNSGVAKAIRAQYPAVYEADCETIKGDPDKLGSMTFTPALQDLAPVYGEIAKIGLIFNLYGQYNYGREKGVIYTDLKALGHAFATMKLFLDAMGITKVGLPKLGAGLGGAKWEDVESCIITELHGLDITIYSK